MADPDSGSFITVWGPLPIARVASPAQGVCTEHQPEVPGRACEAQSLLWGPRIRGASAGGCVHACEGTGCIVWILEGSPIPEAAPLSPGASVPPTFPVDLQWTCADHGLARRGELRGQLVREGQVSVTREEGGHCLGVLGWCGGRRSLVASDTILGTKIRNKPPSC